MTRFCSSFLMALACCGYAQTAAPPRFTGEVTRGASFRKEIGRGLALILRPRDDGWRIAVEPAGRLTPEICADDFAGVIGVPLRGYREVDLSASYGNTAAEAVALTPREVDFVLNAEDCKREDARRNIIMWPSFSTQKGVEEAQANFSPSPAGRIVFKILDSKVSDSGTLVEGKDYGKIDWVKFEVTVTFPPKR
jgi:hypothetical protein